MGFSVLCHATHRFAYKYTHAHEFMIYKQVVASDMATCGGRFSSQVLFFFLLVVPLIFFLYSICPSYYCSTHWKSREKNMLTMNFLRYDCFIVRPSFVVSPQVRRITEQKKNVVVAIHILSIVCTGAWYVCIFLLVLLLHVKNAFSWKKLLFVCNEKDCAF